MARSRKGLKKQSSELENFEHSARSHLARQLSGLDDLPLYNWKPNEHGPEGSPQVVFDPWKNKFAANKLRDLVVAKQQAKQWNTKLLNGEDAFIPTTDDKNSVLDPLARRLWNDSRKFTDELREYAAPYQVEIARAFQQFGFSSGKYVFRLKNDTGAISEKHLIFELAYDLDDSLDGVYDIIDDLIFKWEESINDKKWDRALRSSVNMKRLNNIELDKREKRFAERFIDMAKASGVGSFSIGKKKGDVLCPDHGNPMMARKDSPDTLRCLVAGCTKVAKRKKKLEQPKPEQTIGQKLSAVLEGSKEAVLKFEGVVEGANVKGFEPQQFILDEIAQAAKNVSLAPQVVHSWADQKLASTVGTKQSVQLGYQPNDNPVCVHLDQNTHRIYLFQKDQQTGQDIWIDITSVGADVQVIQTINSYAEALVRLRPRMEGRPYY